MEANKCSLGRAGTKNKWAESKPTDAVKALAKDAQIESSQPCKPLIRFAAPPLLLASKVLDAGIKCTVQC